MTTGALISAIIDHYDHVSSGDSDNTTRRAMILQYVQEIFDEVWLHREWMFKHTSDTITILSGTSFIALPTTFQDMGEKGRVYEVSSGKRYHEIPYPDMLDLVYSRPGGVKEQVFAIGDSNQATGQKLFGIPFNVTANTSFDIYFLSN